MLSIAYKGMLEFRLKKILGLVPFLHRFLKLPKNHLAMIGDGIKVIRPFLHYHFALIDKLCAVISGNDLAAVAMSELAFDDVGVVVEFLADGGARQSPEAVAGHATSIKPKRLMAKRIVLLLIGFMGRI